MKNVLNVGRCLAGALALVFCLALSSHAQAPPALFGGVSGNSPSGGELGTVNQTDADFTLIGDPTANGPLVAIAINSSGQMFGSNNAGGSGSGGVLIRIDPATGTSLGTVGTIVDSADQQALTITDFTFQPGTDILFGISSSSGDSKEGNLYTINTTTAVATLVGDTGLERGGLAFAPNGTLYLATVGDSDNPVIAQINPTNAAVIGTPQIMASPSEEVGMDGLAVRPTDGVFFGTAQDSDDLFTIDPTDGDLTFIGSDDSDGGLASLTFGIAPARAAAPALSQIALFALLVALLAGGSIVLARRSRLT